MNPVDLISVASARGLLDEASARDRLGDKPATIDQLVDLGLLRLNDAPKLLDTYHARVAASTGPARCGRCAQPMTRRDSSIVCDPCGISVSFETPSRYTKIKELGSGGFGSVWLARDEHHNRLVALKFLTNVTDEDLARFKREAVLAASLSHPNIAPVYEFSLDPPFIAMQFVEGKTADAFTGKTRDAARIIRDAARAVHAAHLRGIIHRDLKPQNLMVDARGHLFVMDFGLAKRLDADSSLSQSGLIIGTPHFMSPEQASGAALDARSDIYSLGVTLYALASGRLPFEGTQMEVLQAVVNDDPPPPHTDADLAVIIGKAMRKEPDHRYATADALADDLDRFLKNEAIEARPASIAYRLRKRVAKNPWAWTLAMTAVLSLAVAGVAFSLRSHTFEQKSRAKAAIAEAENALKLWRDERFYPIHDVTPARKKVKAAITLLQEALALEPDAHDARATLGWAYLELGEYDAAIRTLEPTMARSRVDGRSVFWLGSALQAKADALRLIAVRNEDAATRQGNASEADRLDETGRTYVQRAIDAAAPIPDAEIALARAWQLLKAKGDLEPLQSLAAGTGQASAQANYRLAIHIRSCDRAEESLACLRESIRRAPSFLDAYLLAAMKTGCKRHVARSAGATLPALDPLLAEADAFLDSALRIDPSLVDAWQLKAMNAYIRAEYLLAADGDPAESLVAAIKSSASRAIELDPSNAESWEVRGMLRALKAKADSRFERNPAPAYQLAVDVDFSEAVRLQPGTAGLKISRGEARLDWAQSLAPTDQEALTLLKTSLALDFEPASRLEPENPSVWVGIASAKHDWGRYLAAQGENPESLYRSALQEDLQRAAALRPNQYSVLSLKAKIRLNWADHVLSTDADDDSVFKDAAKGDPPPEEMEPVKRGILWISNGFVQLKHAEWLNARGRDSMDPLLSAVDAASKAIDCDPTDAMYWLIRGTARTWVAESLMEAGEDPTAYLTPILEVDCARACQLDPDSADTLETLGTALAVRASFEKKQGRLPQALQGFSEAEKTLTRALEADANHDEALCRRAWARRELGRKTEALEDLEKAASLNPCLPHRHRTSLRTLREELGIPSRP